MKRDADPLGYGGKNEKHAKSGLSVVAGGIFERNAGMNSTIAPSTANALDGVAPEYLDLVRRACDAYCKQCEKAKQASGDHSRQVRAGITKAIETHRRQMGKKKPHERTSYLMKHLEANPGKFGLKTAPDSELVKRLIDAAFPVIPDL